jgi:tRNA pseudouridine13 synthase
VTGEQSFSGEPGFSGEPSFSAKPGATGEPGERVAITASAETPSGGEAVAGSGARARVYLSQDVAGIGGRLKERPEDFLVDEVPLYTPTGEGEHIYLTVQKKGVSTLEMLRVIARHFGVRVKDVGYAGLKDKHAVTRQAVTVYAPGRTPDSFAMLDHPAIGVLGVDRHANKLRPGHLRGNRFSIKVRGVSAMDVRHAWATLRLLARVGAPNRIGEQRFGLLENNHAIGRAIIAGDFEGAVRELLGPSAARPGVNGDARRLFVEGRYEEAIVAYPRDATIETRVLRALARGRGAKDAILSLDETSIRFYLTSFQSAAFNAVLDERLARQTLATLSPGDLAIKHANHAVFAVDEGVVSDPNTEARLASMEVSPSGPMWGASMMRASGPTLRAEVASLEACGMTLAQMDHYDAHGRYKLEGKRRPLRVPVIDPEVEGGVDEHGPFVRCAFELPRGAFATVVMREVMKPRDEGTGEGDAPPEEGEEPANHR